MDPLLTTIADYVMDYPITSDLAIKTAQKSLLDSFACAILALKHPACRSLLGPYIPGTKTPFGSRVPGTSFELDFVKAAFDIGSCIRWLDYNDTWLAAEWGHPSDNLGGILAVSDYLSNENAAVNFAVNAAIKSSVNSAHNPKKSITLQDLWHAMIKAYEIQGILALENAFNRLGFDHVFLVKLATAAVVSSLFGFSKPEIMATLSHVFVDGASLRSYRHAPNTIPRKSWAAGDATRRGVELAWLVKQGQPGLQTPLTQAKWGFDEVILKGNPLKLPREFGTYVMENILFKVAYPAEFHAQTALEAAIFLHSSLNIENIDRIEIGTQEAGFRIIHKEGPLHNFADRDHSLQYITAIGLLFGDLKPEDYGDERARDPRIDALRSKMQVKEIPEFTRDYHDPNKRAIPNSLQIFFRDGTQTEKKVVSYPLGHKTRRQEAEPKLKEKYENAIKGHFSGKQLDHLLSLWENIGSMGNCEVSTFMEYWSFNDK